MKKTHILLLILLILLAAVYIVSNKFIKTKGYDGLKDFIPSLVLNKMNTAPAQDTLFIKMDQDSYDKLSAIRDEALERGIIVNPEDPWVGGKITLSIDEGSKGKGDKVKVKLRLKGKMTDHVKGNKWSFRVKTKKGKLIHKMHRFSLQHPGTRNYIYEWIHQTLAKDQGMMALSYQFVHVYLNKEDLGIYALEENFDKELALNNNRPLGPIFRFDPDAYWEYRLLGVSGYSLKPEYTTFQSSYVDPMRSYSVKDSTQRQYFEEALFLMNSFREGKISASQALNIELFAKKYAILDLIGGHHSVDWSDVKFYYDPIQKKIEPIAYESFSAHRIRTLIGFDKFRKDEAYHDDFHTVLFSDSTFYASYIHYLLKYAKEDFMPSFLAENDSALQANIRVLNDEFAYKRFETDTYTYNAKVIRKLLDPEYPLHVFTRKNNGVTELQLGNVSSLPLNIIAVKSDNYTEVLNTNVLNPKLSNGFVNYRSIPIHLADSIVPRHVVYRILGEDVDREAEVFAYAHPNTESISENAGDYRKFIGKLYDQKGDTLIFKPGSHVLDEDILIPENMFLIANAGLKLSFVKDAHIFVKGKLVFKGYSDNPIRLDNPQFVFLNAQKSLFTNVMFEGMQVDEDAKFMYPAAFVGHHTSLQFSECIFENAQRRVLYISNTNLEMNSCTFYEVEEGIKADFSSLTLNGVNFSSINDNAISLDASHLKANDLFIKNCASKGINAEKWSVVTINNVEFSICKEAMSVKSGSEVNGKGVLFNENEVDMEVKSKVGYGITKLSLFSTENLDMVKVEKDEESEVVIE